MFAVLASRRRLARRLGFGFVLGASAAIAPFAVATASADSGPAAPVSAPAVNSQPSATPAHHLALQRTVSRVVPAVLAKVAAAPALAVPPRAVSGAPARAVPARAVPPRAGTPLPGAAQSATVTKAAAVRAPVVQAPVAQFPVAHATRQAPVAVATRQAAARIAPRIAAVKRPIVVIGASISTGFGVDRDSSFTTRLGDKTGKPVYVSAKHGAAYGDGEIARLTSAANLSARNPTLVVLQAGSNDVGSSQSEVAGQVRRVVQQVRSEAPNARIALVTVFPTVHSGAKAQAMDGAIIAAARSVDPSVAVISPISEHWIYLATGDGHPEAGAHEKLAEKLSELA